MENKKTLGLAVVGCGVVGRMRSTLAKEYPGIGWIGLADINEKIGQKGKKHVRAQVTTTTCRPSSA